MIEMIWKDSRQRKMTMCFPEIASFADFPEDTVDPEDITVLKIVGKNEWNTHVKENQKGFDDSVEKMAEFIKRCGRLQSVEFGYLDQIAYFPENMFENNASLAYFSVRHCDALKTFPEKLFWSTPELQCFVCESNDSLEQLPVRLFWNCKFLWYFDCIWCRALRSIDRDLFVNCPEIDVCQICRNGMESVPDDLLRNCINVKTFVFARN